MLTLYVMLCYALMNGAFKLIDLLPSAVMDWIGGRAGGTDDGAGRLGGRRHRRHRARRQRPAHGPAARRKRRIGRWEAMRAAWPAVRVALPPPQRRRGPLLAGGPPVKGDAHEEGSKGDGDDHRRAADDGQAALAPMQNPAPLAATASRAMTILGGTGWARPSLGAAAAANETLPGAAPGEAPPASNDTTQRTSRGPSR